LQLATFNHGSRKILEISIFVEVISKLYFVDLYNNIYIISTTKCIKWDIVICSKNIRTI